MSSNRCRNREDRHDRPASRARGGRGNIFLGDDGFGVAVAQRLAEADLPSWAQIADYGISGVHLAYDLLGGYDTTVLIDATRRGGEPGTLYLIEISEPGLPQSAAALDAHGMQPDAVLSLLRLLDGDAARVLVVGCEPANVAQGIGLSPPVEAAIQGAVDLVSDLLWNGNLVPHQPILKSEV
jgi:hydrogenase maturation protease